MLKENVLLAIHTKYGVADEIDFSNMEQNEDYFQHNTAPFEHTVVQQMCFVYDQNTKSLAPTSICSHETKTIFPSSFSVQSFSC